MSKTACKDSDVIDHNDPKFECKKCGATVKKEKHVCKPHKIKKISRLRPTYLSFALLSFALRFPLFPFFPHEQSLSNSSLDDRSHNGITGLVRMYAVFG